MDDALPFASCIWLKMQRMYLDLPVAGTGPAEQCSAAAETAGAGVLLHPSGSGTPWQRLPGRARHALR